MGRSLLRVLFHAIRLRCPNCGGGPVFTSWFRMCPNCPACGLHFDREPEGGYWVGSYTINLFATELVLGTIFLWGMVAGWPDPPWNTIITAEAGTALGFPALFFPFSRTLFLALDLYFRPREPDDFAEPRELAPTQRGGRR
jgi:uncharacterized protein (DUF983 family)